MVIKNPNILCHFKYNLLRMNFLKITVVDCGSDGGGVCVCACVCNVYLHAYMCLYTCAYVYIFVSVEVSYTSKENNKLMLIMLSECLRCKKQTDFKMFHKLHQCLKYLNSESIIIY